MNKRMVLNLIICISFAATLLLLAEAPAFAAPHGDRPTLVIYDSPGEYGKSNGTLQSLIRSLLVYGADIDLVGMREYASGTMAAYPYVFVLCLNGTTDNPALYADSAAFGGKIFWLGREANKFIDARKPPGISCSREKPDYGQLRFDFGMGEERFLFTGRSPGQRIQAGPETASYGVLMNGAEQWPYVVRSGNVWVAALFNENNILHYALSAILKDFYGYAPPGELYVKLDYVYPISDYGRLSEMAQYLGDRGIPFIFDLMPIYYNADMPAMDDYVNLIQYMQQNGGVPIIHFPIFNPANFTAAPDPERVTERLQLAIENYTKRGIYPMGIQAPESMLYYPGLNPVFERFSTYIAEIGNGKDVYTVKDTAADPPLDGRPFKMANIGSSINELRLPSDADSAMNALALAYSATHSPGVSLAVSMPSWLPQETFKMQADMIARMGFKVKDILEKDHTVSWDGISIECKNKYITFNGIGVSLKRPAPKPAPTPQYSVRETQVSATNKRMHIINQILTAVAAASCLILLGAFIAGRRINIKKFLRR